MNRSTKKAHEGSWREEMLKQQEERSQLITRIKLLRTKAICRGDEMAVVQYDHMLEEMGIRVGR